MRFRQSFSTAVAPINKPRILRATRFYILPPKIQEGKIDEHDRFAALSSSLIDISVLSSPRQLALGINLKENFAIGALRSAKIEATNLPVSLKLRTVLQTIEVRLRKDISDDIFTALEQPSIRGKKYIQGRARSTKVSRRKPRVKSGQFIDGSTGDSIAQRARSLKSKDTIGPSFFDLIKPLLFPPPTLFSDANPPFLPSDKKPYHYQIRGIEKLIANQAFLLADEMGTGKTVMATLALRILLRRGEVKRALILCPVSVLRVWEEHLQEWSLGEIAFILVRGTPQQRELMWHLDFHVFVTSYDVFSRDIRNGRIPQDKAHFDLVILDEAQYIKNRKSARFRSLQQAFFKRKWAMTGTPLENRVDDVKALFEFLKPGLVHPEETSPVRIRKYIQPYMLRRLKREVLSELPPKRRQWRWLEMSKEQRRQYELVRQKGVAELSELKRQGRVSRVHIFTLLAKLKQICNFPQGKLESPKARETINLVEEIIASGEKVIIFSQFIEEGIAKLAEILKDYNVVQLTGNMSSSQRQMAIDSFRTDPNVSIFLISLKAGGTGLTLTEASYVIHFDHWWNPAVMNQAEDRVHRAGQKKAVMIYELGMEDSIERRIYEILEEKKALARQVIDDLAEGISLEDLDISIDEWLHRVFQIPSSDKENSIFTVEKAKASKHSRVNFVPSWNAKRLDEVRKRLYQMNPTQFEKLVAEVFLRFGYSEVLHQGKTADGGIDVLAKRYDETGVQYAIIQCKRYTKNVGVTVARDLAGVLSQQRSDYQGYIVTSSNFTAQCKKFVAKTGGRIKLINGLELARYVLQYGLEDML